jgi:serine/threonine protein kinase
MASGRDQPTKRSPAPPDSVPDQDYVSSDELFGELVDAPMPAPPTPAKPARPGPIKVQVTDPRSAHGGAAAGPRVERVASDTEVDALLSRIEPLLETPPVAGAPEAPPAPDFEEELPVVAARTGTKFQAAAPAPPAAEEGGLDLAVLAESAITEATPLPPPSRGKGVKEGAWRDDRYGPYRLLDRIAVGGMAEVFKAKRSGVEGFEKIVAMKRILPHLSDNKEFVDMFVAEAKMVAGLTHPNIVQIFDLGRIETSYYIAMEYVHGRDLRTILKRAKEKGLRMPLDLCLRIVGQVCSALEYAHRKKDDRGRPMQIVHRDVSPQNILISFEGDVKLTDFGIAKAATKASSTDRGALRGKLLYMSPEQAWGRSMDRRSDLFSLGIVLYEMITDQKPFLGGGTEMSILEMVRQCHIEAPRKMNPRIPESLDAVVMKSLGREPEERFQDAGEMHRALDKVLRERQPPSASELARFMEVLFDRHEREEAVPEDHPSGEHGIGSAEHLAGSEGEDEGITALPDPMSVDVLLRRFGIK